MTRAEALERLVKAVEAMLEDWDARVVNLAERDPSFAFDLIGDPPPWVKECRAAIAAVAQAAMGEKS